MADPVGTEPLLELDSVTKRFVTKRQGHRSTTVAAADVSLTISEGDAFGLVGESGSGKTTLANMIMGLERVDQGEIRFRGRPISKSTKSFPYGDIQIVFQDPQSSLDPRMKVRELLREPLVPLKRTQRQRMGSVDALAQLLHQVGLASEHLDRRSHEFSGGQRQRIAIARALITKPSLVVLDEPTSSLDVSVQAQILNLLVELQAQYHLSYLFISHNLAVIRHLCTSVAVMQNGSIVEMGNTESVFDSPQHEYTKTLLGAAPTLPAGAGANA